MGSVTALAHTAATPAHLLAHLLILRLPNATYFLTLYLTLPYSLAISFGVFTGHV